MNVPNIAEDGRLRIPVTPHFALADFSNQLHARGELLESFVVLSFYRIYLPNVVEDDGLQAGCGERLRAHQAVAVLFQRFFELACPEMYLRDIDRCRQLSVWLFHLLEYLPNLLVLLQSLSIHP